jgi:hypothetical protein
MPQKQMQEGINPIIYWKDYYVSLKKYKAWPKGSPVKYLPKLMF